MKIILFLHENNLLWSVLLGVNQLMKGNKKDGLCT